MKINITAGDILNAILQEKYPNEVFVPFCEAMIEGEYSSKLFSQEFIMERCKTHKVSKENYLFKLKGFLDFLATISNYHQVVMWFGEDPFCLANIEVVFKTLEEYGYQGKLTLHTVDETTGEIVGSRVVR